MASACGGAPPEASTEGPAVERTTIDGADGNPVVRGYRLAISDDS